MNTLLSSQAVTEPDKHKVKDMDRDSDSDSDSVRSLIVVMGVGAGRGPLVQAALSASSSTNIPIRVFAVEKNTNAVITLRNRCVTESWNNVGE